MNVLRLVKIRLDSQLDGAAADVGQGGLGGLLHDAAQVAGELYLAGAGHHARLHLQDLAPHLGPGQAVDHAYLLRPGQPLRVIAADTQIVLQVISCDVNRLYTI